MVKETVACLVEVALGSDEVNVSVEGVADRLMMDSANKAIAELTAKKTAARSSCQNLEWHIRGLSGSDGKGDGGGVSTGFVSGIVG